MKYKIIYCDPPWSYQDKNCHGAVGNHYNTMSLQDIKLMKVNEIMDKDSILFLWIPYPLLNEGLEVIKAWGLKYKSIGFQWIKLNKKNKKPFFGLGRWTRGNTEPCFIAVKGKPKRVSNSVFQLIQEPIQGHSKKPDCVRDKIVELCGNVSRIELFARQRVEGWDAIGYDIDGMDINDSLQKIIEKGGLNEVDIAG